MGKQEVGKHGGNTRVFTVEHGTATTLARALRRMLAEMRPDLPVGGPLPADHLGKKAGKPTPEKKKTPAGKDPAPVTFTPVGNKLIVTTDDPAVMRLVADLIRHQPQPTIQCDFYVIRLKHTRADSVARVLDEAFNGTRSGKSPISPERIRVVADPHINALLLRASALDTLVIRELVERELDVPAAQSPEKPGKEKKLGRR